MKNLTKRQFLWFHTRMRELLMGVSDLTSVWFVMNGAPGLMQILGYLFGVLAASWVFDEKFWLS